MSRRRPPAPPPGRAALATAVREAYPHGVAAVVAVVDAAFAALEARLTPRMVALEAEVAALRRRVAADSTTSSKPPSTDLSRAVRPVSLREASGRRPGGQRGHAGETLAWRAAPDVVVVHRPGACAACGRTPSPDAVAAVVERAQVVDLPPVALVTTEHRRVAVACAHCGHATAGALPPGVLVGVQYGAEVKALAVALHSYHLLPYGRTAECLHALLGTGPSPGTLARWTRAAAAALAPGTRRQLAARYDALLRTALRRHPYPVQGRGNTRAGRPQRGRGASFADRLLKNRTAVLCCAGDARVPPDNNQAERDLRMAKLADKISGGFRSLAGAHAFATPRSALSTARKQGRPAVAVLRDAFAAPLGVAPASG